MQKKFNFTIQFSVDKDEVPGQFHRVEDWIRFVTADFIEQQAYHPWFQVTAMETVPKTEAEIKQDALEDQSRNYAATDPSEFIMLTAEQLRMILNSRNDKITESDFRHAIKLDRDKFEEWLCRNRAVPKWRRHTINHWVLVDQVHLPMSDRMEIERLVIQKVGEEMGERDGVFHYPDPGEDMRGLSDYVISWATKREQGIWRLWITVADFESALEASQERKSRE